MKRIFILIILAALLSIAAISALAYVVWDDGKGHDLHWSSTHPLTPFPPRYKINFRGTPDSSGEFAAIQKSFKTWEDVLSAEISFEYDGKTNLEAGYDWNNVLTWVEEQWIETTGAGSSVIALTTVTFSTSNGWISDADIEFNGENYTWSESGQVGNDIIDIENVATHEIGHFFGLDHVDNSSYCKDASGVPIPGCSGAGYTEATMYAFTNPDVGETKKRDLDIDDIEGVSYLYPVTVDHFVVELGSGVSTPVTAGTPFDITVTARDSTDNIVTTYTGIIHFESSDTNSTLPSDYTFTGGESGTQSFSNVILSTTGDQTITVTDTTDARISGSLITIPVVTSPSPATVSLEVVEDCLPVDLYTPVTVVARDANGDIDEGYNGTIALTSTDPAATLPSAPYTFIPEDNGVHSFYNEFIFRTVGQISITVDDGTIIDTKTGITLTTDPVASDDTATLAKGGTLSVVAPGVLENDSDPDGDPLTAVLISGPSYAVVPGGFTLYSNGSYTYTHDGSNNLTDSFTYETRDDSCGTARATVTITMFSNAAPTATSAIITTDEDTPSTGISPSVTDPDPSDTHTFSIVSQPTNGSASVANNQLFYTPNSNFNGPDSFTFRATDSGNLWVDGTANVTVNAVSDAPTNTALPVVTGTLEEGQSLSTTDGTWTDNSNPTGAITYQYQWRRDDDGVVGGESDISGANSSTYSLSAADLGKYLSVSVTATANSESSTPAVSTFSGPVTNTAPAIDQAPGPLTVSMDEDGSPQGFVAPTVTATDPNTGDTLTWSLASSASNGTATVSGTGVSSPTVFDYVPNANASGSDSFTVQVSDGTDKDIIQIDVAIRAVNDPPLTVNDTATATEDTPLVIAAASLLSNDTDIEGDMLSVTAFTQTGNGIVVDNGDGTYTYTPITNFNGNDSFTYTASDGNGGNDTATVNVTVNPTNDPPVANNDNYSVNEGAVLNIDSASGVLANDSDVENDLLTAVWLSGPSNGTLTIKSDGSFTYTNNGSEATSDSFTYQADDGAAGSLIATVNITVNPVNDSPKANADTVSVDEDSTANNLNVLGNDTDVDPGDTKTITVVGTTSNGGTVTINGGGPNNTVLYSPAAGFVGTETFTYTMRDAAGATDTATVTIAVNALALLGGIQSVQPQYIFRGAGAWASKGRIVGVTQGPVDFTVTVLTFSNQVLGPFGSEFLQAGLRSYQVWLDPGIYTLIITAQGYNPLQLNGLDVQAGYDLRIDLVFGGRPPVASNDTYTTDEDTQLTVSAPGVLANDTDLDGDPLTAVLDVGPGSGALILYPDGSFDYTPNPNFSGTDSFSYHANDGALDGNTAKVDITVNAVNDPPVASDDFFNVDEDSTDNTLDVLGNDTDVDPGDTKTITVVGATSNGGTVTINGAGPNNTLLYSPAAGFVGTETFTYTIRDTAGATDTATVTVNINDLNEAPSVNPATFSVDENSAGGTSVGTATATDPEGNSLTWSITAGNSANAFSINASTGEVIVAGSLDFETTPTYNLTVEAVDDGVPAETGSATVTVNINDLNEAPSATSATITTDEDTASAPNAPAVTDPDVGDTHTFMILTQPANGTAAVVSNLLVYTPNADFNGGDSFTFQATDSGSLWVHGTATVTVNAINDSPKANADTVSVDEDSTANNLNVLGNDTDVDPGDTKTITVVGTTSNGGTVTINGGGPNNTVLYSPAAGFVGTETFTYTMRDAAGATDTATVTIAVNALALLGGIQSVQPQYIFRGAGAWASKGRIVGVTQGPVDFTVTVLTFSNQVLGPFGSEFLQAGLRSYQVWLDPGIYTLIITAQGYNPLQLNGLDVQAGYDLRIDLVFGGRPPVASNDTYTTDEDTQLTVSAPGVLANDTDLDGDPLTAVLDVGPGSGALILYPDGSFDYTPNPNFSGTDSFSYHANDGALDGNTAKVDITVNAVNDPPVATNVAITGTPEVGQVLTGSYSYTDADQDLEGTSIFRWLRDGVAIGGATALTYVPVAADQGSSISFEVTPVAQTGLSPGLAVVSVGVGPIAPANTVPVASDDLFNVDEDSTDNTLDVLGNDTDVDPGDTKTITAVGAISNGGTVIINGGGPNNTLLYSPAAGFVGTETFTYTMRDAAGATDTATVTITVNALALLGDIQSVQPQYIWKGAGAWASKGRIVGVAQGPVDFTVTVLTSSNQVLGPFGSESLQAGLRSYQAWLDPGIYTLIITAQGYNPLQLNGLDVQAGYDLRIDLVFGGP